MEFKDALKKIRKEKGVSQYTLAKELFVSRSMVAKWENGLALPKDDMKKAIIDYFKIPKDYFENSEENKIKEFENMNKRCFLSKVKKTLFVCSLFIVLFIIYLIIDYFTINPGYYFEVYDNGLYKYVYENELRLDSYIGNIEDFYIPEEIEIKGNFTKRKYTVESVNLINFNIEKLYIPKTIKQIYSSGACFNYVEVSKENPYFDSRDNCNCIIETANNSIVLASKKNSFIPSTIKEIGEGSFKYTEYENIVLPDSVTIIKDYAFSYMENLKSIGLDQNLEIMESNLFAGCTKLKSILLPDSLSSLCVDSLACSLIENAYYAADQEKFPTINLDTPYCHWSVMPENCFCLTIPTFKLYYYSYYEPKDKGNTWHYNDGKIEVWR